MSSLHDNTATMDDVELQVPKNSKDNEDDVTVATAQDDEDDFSTSLPSSCNNRRALLAVAGVVSAILMIVLGVSLSSTSSSTNSPTTVAPPSLSTPPVSDSTLWQSLGDVVQVANHQDAKDLSLSLSDNGSVMAIGNRNDGTVRVYHYTNSDWVLLGSAIQSTTPLKSHGSFGVSLDLSGDGMTVAIGAHLTTKSAYADPGLYAGQVSIWRYEPSKSDWKQVGQDLDGTSAGEQAGFSLSLSDDGNVVAVGAHLYSDDNNDQEQRTGQVRVYTLHSNLLEQTQEWIPMGQELTGAAGGDQAGGSLSLSADGRMLAVGGRFYDANDDENDNVGHVRIFGYRKVQDEWRLLEELVGETVEGEFGYSVALDQDGGTIAVGNAVGEVAVYRYGLVGMDARFVQTDQDIVLDPDTLAQVQLNKEGNVLAVSLKTPLVGDEQTVVVYALDESRQWVQADTLVGQVVALSGDGASIALANANLVQVLNAHGP